MKYPESRRCDQVDDHHGTKVADPYRWLEDPDSDETKEWVRRQNELTFAFLEKIPERARIRERLTRLWDYEKVFAPSKERGRYFYYRNDGLQPQNVLHVTDSLDSPGKVLLDPNLLSKDGTVALGGTSVSDDSRYLAYGIARSGSDWNEWRVRDVDTGEDLADELRWIKFSGASWKKDGSGFFYSRYPEPRSAEETGALYHQKLYFHRLGTKQSEDVLVYERPDEKEWGFGGTVTEDGRWLVISVWKGTAPKNQIFLKDLSVADGPVAGILTGFEHGWDYVANDGRVFWFKTDKDAPRGKVVRIDLDKAKLIPIDVVPQAKEAIESVSCVGDLLHVSYLKDAHTHVRVFALSGEHVRDVALPGVGTAYGFSGRRTDEETFYGFTSYTSPAAAYRYDVKTGASTLWKRPKVDFDPEKLESKQVFVTSKDGTRVPLSITHRKGLALDGKNPTILYGYGGFNVSLTPAFSVGMIVWMEMGGVFAVANLRGGGEYGEEWHQAGTKKRKQNVFDDFIACAEWLQQSGHASSKTLAIEGGSNGGLLVGACLAQRPELFGAALPAVGVMDMLRFHKFTIGWAWVDDYGSSDDPEMAPVLHAYSPLHNLKKGVHYPPTLVTTADHDDRVVPGHSFKFTAALQHAQGGPAPVLIRVDVKAGHGAGKPTQKVIDERSDELAFLWRVLGPRSP